MIRFGCHHYKGSKPCRFKRTCAGCPHFEATGERILVIKLGALGDLLRSTPLLQGLKQRFPHSEITWITQPSCLPLLENLSEIDRIWPTDTHVLSRVLSQEFDRMINLDKETPAVELATLSRAKAKFGFGLSREGRLVALNPGSEYALELGLNDELKFRRNEKTYQQIIYEMAELTYPRPAPAYRLALTEAEKNQAADWFREQVYDRERRVLLGVHPGCGRVFATKKWIPQRYAEVLQRLYAEDQVIPVLFGGPDEQEVVEQLFKTLRRKEIPVLRPGENLSLRQFLAYVGQCQGMLTGDTLAMHVALAQNVPTVALFTSTCAQEIEFYGKGVAVVGRASCAPCYLSQCRMGHPICAESLSVDEVYGNVRKLLELESVEKVADHSHV